MLSGEIPSSKVFEDEELNFDTRLEGLSAQYHHDRGSLAVIGGSNRGNRFRGVYAEPATWGPVRAGGAFVEVWGGGEETELRDREQHADIPKVFLRQHAAQLSHSERAQAVVEIRPVKGVLRVTAPNRTLKNNRIARGDSAFQHVGVLWAHSSATAR